MIHKRLKRSIFATLVGLSIIVLCITAYGLFRKVNVVTKRVETVVKVTLINSINVHASLRDSLVSFGMEYLGTPYRAGGNSKNGFDCSGFVSFVYNHFRIYTPRSSSQFQYFGKVIPIDSVRKGDILVFLSPTRKVVGHVGIVTNPKGKESDFIHASSGKEMKVIITSLKKEGYKRRFVKAIDVL
jgi:cell wall-associated NlpC family hydrolase